MGDYFWFYSGLTIAWDLPKHLKNLDELMNKAIAVFISQEINNWRSPF
jgi:hypothetical protein